MSSFAASQSFNVNVARADPLADTIIVPNELFVIATICIVLTTFAVGVRALTQFRHWRREFDDFAIIIAVVGFVAFVVMSLESASAGEGTSISNLSDKSIQRVRLLTNMLSLVYTPTVLVVKVAILVRTARFFTSIWQRTKCFMTYGLVAISVAGYTAVFFLRLFACTPRAKISNSSVVGQCLPKYADAITAGALGVTTNVAIVVLLWSICPKLQLNRAKTALVVLIMGVGVFACACSILELVYGLELATSQDYSKAVFPINLWALAELASLIIIACCPTLPHSLEFLVGNTSEQTIVIHDKWYSNLSSGSNSPMSKPSSERHTPSPLIISTTADKPKTAPAPRPFPVFEPNEHRISHLSYNTIHPSRRPSAKSLAPPSPMTPISPAFSVRDAWEMKVTPVCTVGNIKRTIQVRISNHTNRSSRSPIQWGALDPKWETKW